MRIAILGTRGIPNNYGGFEQFAEYLSQGLVRAGHEAFVYCGHDHQYKDPLWNKVHLIHKYNPETWMGTFGQFIYDLFCVLDARKRKFDIILQLGYTSSSVWGRLLPKKPVIITNMDGLEWKRTKYSKKVRRFLKHAERWAVKTSDHLIADSVGIQSYLKNTYQKDSIYIPYGADVFLQPNPNVLSTFQLNAYAYNMLIARMEPENNIEMILDGIADSLSQVPVLVIGKYDNAFGKYLSNKYQSQAKIKFLGSIYDMELLNNLRYYSNIYFHGHSVGGTNPSLLEAMGSDALICAHRNEFNGAILGEDALYFSTSNDVKALMDNQASKITYRSFVENNRKKIIDLYSWKTIIDAYEKCFIQLHAKGR